MFVGDRPSNICQHAQQFAQLHHDYITELGIKLAAVEAEAPTILSNNRGAVHRLPAGVSLC